MKKLLLITLVLTGWMSANCQTSNTDLPNGGTVKYEELIKLDIKIEGLAADMAAALPKERRSNKTLVFNQEASLYQNDQADEGEDHMMSGGGANIQIRMAEPDNKLFFDVKKKLKVEQREFMTRVFLIEDKINDADWKLTGNEKTILDYPCREAIREKDDKTVHAWFTPAVPVSTGPAEYLGLPGLVLEVITDDGDRTITAKSIDLADVDNSLLSCPKKGKKVSQEEFDQIVKEKMEEMGAEGGHGHGTFIMKIEK